MKLDIMKTMQVVNKVEARLGHLFEPEEIRDIIEHTIRKCELNSKDEECFYLLFENELEDLIQRHYINFLGFINQMRKEEQRCAKFAE